jgi:dephospho-CoA kinase
MTTRRPDSSTTRRIIGLTGGIGMGKTMISNHLANVHQLPILDADILARLAVAPDSELLTQIRDRYGPGILHGDGTLNRQRLGDIIFTSPTERQWLEQQIHPYIYTALTTALQTPPLSDPQQSPTVVLVMPLLFEARMTDLVTEIWVVYCSRDQQIERLQQRDRLNLEQIQARMSSQMSIEKKIARADFVLDNSGSPEMLFAQIDQAIARDPAQLTTAPP